MIRRLFKILSGIVVILLGTAFLVGQLMGWEIPVLRVLLGTLFILWGMAIVGGGKWTVGTPKKNKDR